MGVTLRSIGARTVVAWTAFAVAVLLLASLTNLDAAVGRGRPADSVTMAKPPVVKSLPTMLVIGDSYSSGPDVPGMEHTDKIGSERRGWWSYLADTLHYRPVLSAEPGSGILKAGLECDGTTFADRIDVIKKTRPDLVIVEGGRNDYRYCEVTTSMASGKPVSTYHEHPSTPAAVRTAARLFLKKLRDTTDSIGLDPDRVYVMAPWGLSVIDRRTEIERILAEATRQAGFTYVDIPALTSKERYDETHPNGLGSKRIYEHVLKNSDISRFSRTPAR